MKAASNSIGDIQKYFESKLQNIFDVSTIQTYFYWCTEFFLQLKKIDVKLNPNFLLSESEILKFHYAAKKLAQNTPIQYVVGKTSFYHQEFLVNEHVLIPRPETEELVDWVVKDQPKGIILDIGTGSGCIAISLAKFLPKCKVYALDVSTKAMEVAKQNANYCKVDIEFINLDILQAKINASIPQKLDVIISNPPYIPQKDKSFMQANVLEHEPHLALFVTDDNPFIFYQKIIREASECLNINGILYLEIHEDYVEEIKEIAINNHFKNVEIRKDLQGKNRMLKCFF
jgi:release factor glutamine methyltransferase